MLQNVSSSKKPVKTIDRQYFSQNIDSLEQEFGQNKIILNEYKLQILITLTYFPELKDKMIIFKKGKLPSTMNCIPKISKLLNKPSKRAYVIRFNTKQDFKGILLKDAPFNGQIGAIGHELSHILDYNSRNFWKIIRRVLDYLSNKSKEKYEKEIDKITIKKGFGWQLFDWANFVLNKSSATDKYKEFKRRIYLEPEEILKIIKTDESYNYNE